MRTEPGAEIQRVRNAGHAGECQHIGGCRLVACDLVSSSIVQSDVIPECEAALRSTLHDDQPAAGFNLDRNFMRETIFPDRIDEYSLAGKEPLNHFPFVAAFAAINCQIGADLSKLITRSFGS